MMKITGLSHLFKWENLHNLWLTKYFFCPTVFIYREREREILSEFKTVNSTKDYTLCN